MRRRILVGFVIFVLVVGLGGMLVPSKFQLLTRRPVQANLIVTPPSRPVVEGLPPDAANFKPLPPVSATVKIEGTSQTATPNSIGLYPQMKVSPGSTVQIELAPPSGDSIAVMPLDGGRLVEIKESVGNKFDFHVQSEPGSYRVAVYDANGRRQILNFWVPFQGKSGSKQ